MNSCANDVKINLMKFKGCIIIILTSSLITFLLTTHYSRSTESKNLKEQKERYDQADQILAKILQVLMLDLGIKLSNDQISIIKAKVQADYKKEKSSTPVGAENKQEEQTKANIISQTPAPQAATANRLNWASNETKLKDLRSDEEIKEFLKTVSPTNFIEALKEAKPVDKATEEGIGFLSGRYKGSIFVFDQPKEPVSISMSIELDSNIKHNNWLKIKTLISGNVPFSRTISIGVSIGGDATLNIKDYGDKSAAMIIELSQNTEYLQLYYLEQQNIIIGNVFFAETPGQFKLVGTLKMEPEN